MSPHANCSSDILKYKNIVKTKRQKSKLQHYFGRRNVKSQLGLEPGWHSRSILGFSHITNYIIPIFILIM